MRLEELPEIAKINGEFGGKDIVSIDQFDVADADKVVEEAARISQADSGAEHKLEILKGKVVANLFYEPSTRTFLSFEAAAKRLGASTISTQGVEFSSISKDETLEDTVRTVERYADLIVLRHSQVGAAAVAAAAVDKPIINAGDGVGEHPTQALLDLFTIKQQASAPPEELTVTMLGDLKNGRTVHSLARILSKYGSRLNFVSPRELKMPENLTRELGVAGVLGMQTEELGDVLAESDVVYATRVQKERFASHEEYEDLKDHYTITPQTMKGAKSNMILMHPLPRVGEISTAVDDDPRAIYFDQVENGMYVRMALLDLVCGRTVKKGS